LGKVTLVANPLTLPKVVIASRLGFCDSQIDGKCHVIYNPYMFAIYWVLLYARNSGGKDKKISSLPN
jgi:hypothetical protein